MDVPEMNTGQYAYGKGPLRAVAATTPGWDFARA
jgi:hypothetical protein